MSCVTEANDSSEFFQQLKNAQTEVFEWLQDEFHFYLNDNNPARIKRDIVAENGDDWYRNFECRVNNKSCSIGMPLNDVGHRSVNKISELLGNVDLVQKHRIQSTMRYNRVDDDVGEKLQAPKPHNNDNGRINDKNMEGEIEQQKQHLAYDVSDHRTNIHAKNSNDNSAINGLLNVRASIAAKENEIHEIEMRHQKHLTDSSSSSSSMLPDSTSSHTSSTYLDENLLNDNQLDDVDKREQNLQHKREQHRQMMINEYTSNSNFHSNHDTSLENDVKRSSGQKQIHYDDQLDTKQNNLYDELKDMSNFQHQMRFNEPHHRVKRRDVINQINYRSEKDFDGLDNSIDYDNDEMNYNNSLVKNDNQQHVNTSAVTTKQDMNNVNEKISNDKSDYNESVNNNNETIGKMPTSSSNNAKIIKKRDIGDLPSRSQHEHLYSIKGRQKISDLISGELPNEIVKAVNKLVNSNDMLRRYVKPHLNEPNYTILKDSTRMSSIKINNMMSELSSYINELVNDQVQMKSCIPLTPELQEFYEQLTGRNQKESAGNVIYDDDDNSIQKFLMTKRKTKRNVNHIHSPRLELIEKCDKLHHFHTKCLQITECKQFKPSLILYFKRHEEICSILKKSYEVSPLTKFKRSFEGLNVSPQFAKLYNFKNYFLESKTK
ncbi:histone H2B.v2-like [Chironomus tepperi]|uniref:histone H2B.v2-like n=1 Tax=Chironomus tepperi TaxID=113505 RepID=UPI00391FADD2